MQNSATATKANKLSFKKKRKQEALDLAVLIYDIYKENQKEKSDANQAPNKLLHT